MVEIDAIVESAIRFRYQRRRQGILSWALGQRSKELSRHQALSPAQALARLSLPLRLDREGEHRSR
jgi:hypothetical protein